MKQYVCSVCGYVYDEAKGLPGSGIAPGTKFEDLPGDWVCPICRAGKTEFREKAATAAPVKVDAPTARSEYSNLEKSILCSNLARGCEKQYRAQEAELFTKLADYFKSAAEAEGEADIAYLAGAVENDIEKLYPYANAVGAEKKDRGALRSLVWSEKVTRMLNSHLARYRSEGDAMFVNDGIHVCTICGFIYVGNDVPDICPVCKVTKRKIEKIEGGQ